MNPELQPEAYPGCLEDGQRSIVREGCGAARGFARTAGEAIEQAIKSAETDATKRAHHYPLGWRDARCSFKSSHVRAFLGPET